MESKRCGIGRQADRQIRSDLLSEFASGNWSIQTVLFTLRGQLGER